MNAKKLIRNLKVWQRSGSWEFMRSKAMAPDPSRLNVITWKGIPLHYRPGTSDCGVIYEILMRPPHKREYYVPAWIRPATVFDIGGNIGITAVYLSTLFPDAKVYTFEPVPQNFAILEKNVATLKNVRAFPFGLGAESGQFEIYPSEDRANLGGYSLHERRSEGANAGVDTKARTVVEIRRGDDVIAHEAIDRIDLIKIDTEGAEYEALTSIGDSMLSRVQWIMGELHGRRDFELLAYLSRWFDIAVNKRMRSELFLFEARNKSLRGIDPAADRRWHRKRKQAAARRKAESGGATE
ncbi:MAG TPA: FkbM family methyltransferase [Burkholderiales bacterium]